MFEFFTLKYFDIFDIDIFFDIFENVARHFDMSKAVVSLDIFRQRHVATTNVVNNPTKNKNKKEVRTVIEKQLIRNQNKKQKQKKKNKKKRQERQKTLVTQKENKMIIKQNEIVIISQG
jgi:hypothetical protein